MIDKNGNAKLADFGGTKQQESIETKANQTGLFTWGWGDAKARNG
jgi:hypothetical protein